MANNTQLEDTFVGELPEHNRKSQEAFESITSEFDSQIDYVESKGIRSVSKQIADELGEDIADLNVKNVPTISYRDILELSIPLHKAKVDKQETISDSNIVSDLSSEFSDGSETVSNVLESIKQDAEGKDIDETANLLKHIADSIRKISEIVGQSRTFGLAKSVANVLGSFSSIYGIMYAANNFVTICFKIKNKFSSDEEIPETYAESFFLSLGLLTAECIFIKVPVSFRFAWNGTRKVSNIGLYRLKRVSTPAYRFVMSRTHYFLQDLPKNAIREIGSIDDKESLDEDELQTSTGDLIDVIGTTASKSMLLEQFKRSVKIGANIQTDSSEIFSEIKKLLGQMLDYCEEYTTFSNDIISNVNSELEDLKESELVDHVSGLFSDQSLSALEAVDEIDISEGIFTSQFYEEHIEEIVSDFSEDVKTLLLDLFSKIIGVVKNILDNPKTGVIQYPD